MQPPRLVPDAEPHPLKCGTFSTAAVFTADNGGPANSLGPAAPPSPHSARNDHHHHYVAARIAVAEQLPSRRTLAPSPTCCRRTATESPYSGAVAETVPDVSASAVAEQQSSRRTLFIFRRRTDWSPHQSVVAVRLLQYYQTTGGSVLSFDFYQQGCTIV